MPRRTPTADRPEDRRVAAALLRWFATARRPLPWRTSRDPYRIWVAEVLLQQTRVAQAIPYFERFVAEFPDVASLAHARPSAVLKAWQGAGYYARARRLHAAALEVVRRPHGTLPRSVDELERLPGVGPYIARAIGAIAFGLPVVPVDANALRVAARWTREERDVRRAEVRSRLREHLERMLPRDRPGAFAEAVMELGETVCRPVRPSCRTCPVAFGCRAARELADPGVLPRRSLAKRRPHVRAAVVTLEHRGRWLVQRRPEPGLLGGLWEFPGGKIRAGEAPEAAARRELREETGATVGPLRPLGVVRHAYSHFTVELHVFRGAIRRPPRLGVSRRWASLAAISRLPLPRATERIVTVLRSAQTPPVRHLRPARPAAEGPEGGTSSRA